MIQVRLEGQVNLKMSGRQVEISGENSFWKSALREEEWARV